MRTKTCSANARPGSISGRVAFPGIFQPDRRRGGRLADLRADRQRLPAGHGRPRAIHPRRRLLVFAAGHAADRYDRRRDRAASARSPKGCSTAVCLALGQLCRLADGAARIFAALYGARRSPRAFEKPGRFAALAAGRGAARGCCKRPPRFPSGVFQAAAISGPALGGVAYAIARRAPMCVMAVCWLRGGACCSAVIQLRARVAAKENAELWRSCSPASRFVRNNPGDPGRTISLDLVAVLLGGATALLPIYAHDILQTGPWGLGVLRAAPAAGALLMTAALARHAIKRRVGLRMFQAVIVFGIATVVFAFSRLVWLSLLALVGNGRGRQGQRGDPLLAGATGHAGRDARPGRRGQFSVHQRLQPARPVRERHHRGA